MDDNDEILLKREEEKRLQQMQAEQDFKWLMGDARGRRLVWAELSAARVFHPVFDQNNAQMAFNEGNRQHGLRLLERVHTLCPHLYPVMVQENTAKPDEANA
ncbi:hypothetical protein [Pseudomonas sp. I2]|uniref:Bbp19 family protein n=1 Tax=Pseudomonas sp. I2 TaxID=1338438 RepID=UPI0034D4B0A3